MFSGIFCIHFKNTSLKEHLQATASVYRIKLKLLETTFYATYPADTGRKLNVHKTFKRRPRRLLNLLRTLNLRPVSTG